MHSVWPDSKGNFWYTYFAAAGKIAPLRLEDQDRPRNTRSTRASAATGSSPTRRIASGRSRSTRRSSSATTRPPTSGRTTRSRCRRGASPSIERAWSGSASTSATRSRCSIPDTGKVTEYDLPLKYGNPYDLWPDADDNIWVENAVYNSLVKFEPATQEVDLLSVPRARARTRRSSIATRKERSGSRSDGRRRWPRSSRRATPRRGATAQ